jgi:uncharacterized alkaline shock family protein YloU
VEKGHVAQESELGRVLVSGDAIAQIVGNTALECYGVVGMTPRGPKVARLLTRDRPTQGVEVRGGEDGLHVELHVVVEYGLNLAEVAATIRTRVAYEVERQTGLRVAAVEVHIQDVRRSA